MIKEKKGGNPGPGREEILLGRKKGDSNGGGVEKKSAHDMGRQSTAQDQGNQVEQECTKIRGLQNGRGSKGTETSPRRVEKEPPEGTGSQGTPTVETKTMGRAIILGNGQKMGSVIILGNGQKTTAPLSPRMETKSERDAQGPGQGNKPKPPPAEAEPYNKEGSSGMRHSKTPKQKGRANQQLLARILQCIEVKRKEQNGQDRSAIPKSRKRDPDPLLNLMAGEAKIGKEEHSTDGKGGETETEKTRDEQDRLPQEIGRASGNERYEQKTEEDQKIPDSSPPRGETRSDRDARGGRQNNLRPLPAEMDQYGEESSRPPIKRPKQNGQNGSTTPEVGKMDLDPHQTTEAGKGIMDYGGTQGMEGHPTDEKGSKKEGGNMAQDI